MRLHARLAWWLALAICIAFCLVAASDAGASPGRAEGTRIAAGHPDWTLPAWTRGGPTTWTMVGAPYAASVALVGADGRFAPRNHGPAIDFWLYDRDRGQFLVPGDFAPALHLDDDFAPLVTTEWHMTDLTVDLTLFAGFPGGDATSWFSSRGGGSDQAVTFIRMNISTSAQQPRQLDAYVALRPFGVEADMHSIGSVRCDRESGSLIADNFLLLTILQSADACGVGSTSTTDESVFASRNRPPGTTATTDPNGGAEVMLRTNVTIPAAGAAVLEYRAPIAQVSPDQMLMQQLVDTRFDDERARVLGAWRRATSRVNFDVSDESINNAFHASQAYLLLNRRGAWPRSGPLAHDASWIRDATYIGQALERTGNGAENQATLEEYMALQREGGEVPAIVDASGPRAVKEWDADGEAIAAIVEHNRFSSDRTWLARMYPSILRAVQPIQALRQSTRSEGPETRNLLPANISAEDLGPANLHHYWDSFWALAGLREAAFAASELGFPDDADSFNQNAIELQQQVISSIQSVQARTGKPFIPNGPEDVVSSAMARGTTPAVWPIAAFQGADAESLLVTSFYSYFAAWLAPQYGGYLHYQGTLWPYGGLGIAHAMLRLGMLPQVHQILGWTLSHQTLPGTYAWGEAINPSNGGLELGDMPHSWAAAELVSLLRDVVLTEQDGVLLVNGGTPDDWLDPGKRIVLRDAPTHYGLASIELRRSSPPNDTSATDLTISLSGAPPRGWRVRIPPNAQLVVIDDAPADPQSGAIIQLPTGPHTVRVIYAPPVTS